MQISLLSNMSIFEWKLIRSLYFRGNLLLYGMKGWFDSGKLFEGDCKWKTFKVICYIYYCIMISRTVLMFRQTNYLSKYDTTYLFMKSSWGEEVASAFAIAVTSPWRILLLMRTFLWECSHEKVNRKFYEVSNLVRKRKDFFRFYRSLLRNRVET